VIRFLIGCLLAIAVLWSVLLTVGIFLNATGRLHDHSVPVRRAAP
jgi:hypothetical protein